MFAVRCLAYEHLETGVIGIIIYLLNVLMPAN
jgi:hypothetical protein